MFIPVRADWMLNPCHSRLPDCTSLMGTTQVGLLDRLGQTKSAEYYEKTMTGQKPLNAKQSYSDRRQYVIANNMMA